MKGKLIKTETAGWVVEYEIIDHTPIGIKSWWEKLPLHCDDVNEILEQEKIFDNVESRIMAYPDVEFKIIENKKTESVSYCAKLIKTIN